MTEHVLTQYLVRLNLESIQMARQIRGLSWILSIVVSKKNIGVTGVPRVKIAVRFGKK